MMKNGSVLKIQQKCIEKANHITSNSLKYVEGTAYEYFKKDKKIKSNYVRALKSLLEHIQK